MAIDPTARVADGARIGEGVEIGPYCLVGPQVELGRGVRLIAPCQRDRRDDDRRQAPSFIRSRRSARRRNRSITAAARRKLVIGAHCELRESVTMNTGTEDGGGMTRVGEHGFFMVGSPCRARLPSRQQRQPCQQRRAWRSRLRRRLHLPRRPCRHPSIRADRRGRHDGRYVGCPRRHHPVRFCAWPDRRAGRFEHCRITAARRDAGRDASAAPRLSRLVLRRQGGSPSGSMRSSANSPTIRWSARSLRSSAPGVSAR